MLYLAIISICSFMYETTTLPVVVKPKVEILQVNENSVEVRFKSIRDALHYTARIVPSEVEEYEDDVQIREIAAVNSSYTTANISTLNLKASTDYNVTIFAITMLHNARYRQSAGVGNFRSNDCISGMYCLRNVSDHPQCFQSKWRCNGVLECTDGLDEDGCDTDSASLQPKALSINSAKYVVLPCVAERQIAIQWHRNNSGTQKSPGPRIPLCDPDDTYAPMQCWKIQEFIYQCACVDKFTGENLEMPLNLDPFNDFGYEDYCRELRGDTDDDISEY